MTSRLSPTQSDPTIVGVWDRVGRVSFKGVILEDSRFL